MMLPIDDALARAMFWEATQPPSRALARRPDAFAIAAVWDKASDVERMRWRRRAERVMRIMRCAGYHVAPSLDVSFGRGRQ